MRAVIARLGLLTLLGTLSSTALAVPMQITHQGRIFDATGTPLEGAHDITLAIYNAQVGGTILWGEDVSASFDNGYFSIKLGQLASNPLDTDLFEGGTWLAIAIDDGAELKRQQIGSVPYAIRASVAENLSGGVVDATEIRVNGTSIIDASGEWIGPPVDTLAGLSCANDQIVRYNTAFKQWACDTDQVLSGADVLAIVEGGPLSLAAGSTIGGVDVSTLTTTEVRSYLESTTVNLASSTLIGGQAIVTPGYLSSNAVELGAGAKVDGQLISTGPHNTYDGSDFALSGKSCSTGEVVTGIASDGSPICADTTYDGTDFALSGKACGFGEVVTGIASNGTPLCADTTYDGSDFALSGKSCSTGEVVTGIATNGNPVCSDATAVQHSGAVYRWNTFDTYHNNQGWLFSNRSDLFGGVAPSNWTDGAYLASHMSADKEVLRTLFTRKGYGGRNATVNSEVYHMYSSTTGRVAVALFRIKNTTSSNINWTPYFYYTCYAGWGEKASVALNGANAWNSGSSNCGTGSSVAPTLSIPANRTSTVIFVSPSSTTYSYGYGIQIRANMLAFYNNSLLLPSGLEYVDDLDTATGGWTQ